MSIGRPEAQTDSVTSGAAKYRLQYLGPFKVLAPDGSDLTPKSRKARALLAYVGLSSNPVPRDRLAALLWGDSGEEQARASLRQALCEVRKFAGAGGLVLVGRDHVCAEKQSRSVDLEQIEIDIRNGEIGGLTAALDRDDICFLADLNGVAPDLDDWLAAERTRRRDRLLSEATEAGHVSLKNGEIEPVQRLVHLLERLDPLSERVARLGMCAEASAGDLASAHRRYNSFQERLKEELGASPAPETQDLFARLKRERGYLPAAHDSGKAVTAMSTPLTSGAGTRIPARKRVWIISALLLLALAAAAFWWKTAAAEASGSLAVLPFQELQAGQSPHLATGLSEEVLSLLAEDRKLRVVGTTSARLLTESADPRQMARSLNVTHLLEGSVRTTGDKVLVLVRLVRAEDGENIWSGRYDRSVNEIFDLQNEIGAAVASQLSSSFSPRVDRNQITDPEVYNLYLAGRTMMRERTETALKEARRLLVEATRRDPNFAPAFAALSQAKMLLANYAGPAEVVQFRGLQAQAITDARRALQLSPTLGEAHAAYGFAIFEPDKAIPHLEKAVALDPQRVEHHHWLGMMYRLAGRHRDATREFERTAALEPLWWVAANQLVRSLADAGEWEEVDKVASRFERVSADPVASSRVRLVALNEQGRLAEAAQLGTKVLQSPRATLFDRFLVAKIFAVLGERDAALSSLKEGSAFGRLVILSDAAGLAAEARRLRSSFWIEETGGWLVSEALAGGGHGALLLELYDQGKPGLNDLLTRGEIGTGATPAPPVIFSLLQENRRLEAVDLAKQALARLNAEVEQGLDPTTIAFQRAQLLALLGQRDAAFTQLELTFRTRWHLLSGPSFKPLADITALRSLRGDPRLANLQARLDAKINQQRSILGLKPLSRSE